MVSRRNIVRNRVIETYTGTYVWYVIKSMKDEVNLAHKFMNIYIPCPHMCCSLYTDSLLSINLCLSFIVWIFFNIYFVESFSSSYDTYKLSIRSTELPMVIPVSFVYGTHKI